MTSATAATGPLVAARRGGERLVHRRRSGQAGDRPGSGEHFQTAAVPARARRAARHDHLVRQLAGPSHAAEVQPATDDNPAADAGAEDERGDCLASGCRTEARFGEGERPGVVDDRCRHAEHGFQRGSHRFAPPRSRQVGEELDRSGAVVEQPRHADGRAVDRPPPLDRLDAGRGEVGDHRRWAVLGTGGPLIAPDDLDVVEDDRLDVRAAEIEPQPASRHRAAGQAVMPGHRPDPGGRAGRR